MIHDLLNIITFLFEFAINSNIKLNAYLGFLDFTITGEPSFDFFFSLVATLSTIIYLFAVVITPLFRR